MRRFPSYVLAFILLLLTFHIQNAVGQIPKTMSYQAVLTDADGNAVQNGNFTITFKLYDVATEGVALWEETQEVSVSKGLFNVILGSDNELDLDFDKPYWLGIKVGDGDELSPRTALTSAPYSLSKTAAIAEPAPGQNFVIKNAEGNTTHVLNSNGDAEHTGTSTFDGGVQIKSGLDSSLVITLNNGYLFIGPDVQEKIPNKDNKNAPNKTTALIPQTRLRVTDIATPKLSSNYVVSDTDGGGVAIKGDATEFGVGVEATTKDGTAVSADAKGSGDGVVSASRGEGEAIVATAFGSGDAIVGTALSSGVGVQGFSTSSNGGWFKSEKGVGIYAKGSPKAAELDGDTDVKGKLKIENVEADPNQQRILVWSDDMIVRYRTLPDGGQADEDWLIDSENSMIMTSNDVVIKDAQGNITTRFNRDGTSLHTGVETFDDDVILKGTDGKGLKLVDATGNTIAGFGRKDLDTGQRIGVFAKAENEGDLAGVFEGDVDVLGEIVASSLHIVNTNGDSLTDFFSDGTSRHRGLETYEAGLKVTNTDGSSAIELVPNTDPQTEYGLRVNGNVMVNGIVNTSILQAEVKQFRIDHPLDPEHKYLQHTSIESSEMKNVYDGSVVLDQNGEASVLLPDWFQALNVDYRYQLTCVGGYASVYIAEEIDNNRFKIAGGQEGLKVCWQVTGIRNDKFAREHRMQVETYKNME